MRLRDSRGAKPQAMRTPLSAGAVLITLTFVLLATAQTALAVEKPVNTVLPTIAGTPKEGVTLKAKRAPGPGARWSGPTQWQRCEPESECANIVSATTSEYKLRFIDIGSQIRVIVTASNSAGSTEATLRKDRAVGRRAAENTALPVISGRAVEGQLLRRQHGHVERHAGHRVRLQVGTLHTRGTLQRDQRRDQPRNTSSHLLTSATH